LNCIIFFVCLFESQHFIVDAGWVIITVYETRNIKLMECTSYGNYDSFSWIDSNDSILSDEPIQKNRSKELVHKRSNSTVQYCIRCCSCKKISNRLIERFVWFSVNRFSSFSERSRLFESIRIILNITKMYAWLYFALAFISDTTSM